MYRIMYIVYGSILVIMNGYCCFGGLDVWATTVHQTMADAALCEWIAVILLDGVEHAFLSMAALRYILSAPIIIGCWLAEGESEAYCV